VIFCDHALLQHLNKIGIRLGLSFSVSDKIDFDGSMEVAFEDIGKKFLSQKITDQLMVTKIEQFTES
jgi:hypothetical protein